MAVPAYKKNSESWTAEDNLAVIIETAAFNEVQLSEYCRSKGLFKKQVDQWKDDALSGYRTTKQMKKQVTQQRQEDKKKIKLLERELKRKEKALAETAALLVLSKKWEAIWGAEEEN